MSLLTGIARVVLTIVNLIFLLLGLALTVVGFMMRYGSEILGSVIDTAVNSAKSSASVLAVGDLSGSEMKFGDIAKELCIGVIVCGLVILAIALVGVIGACCKVKCVLWIYAIVVVVLVVIEIVAVGILYGKPEVVKDGLKKNLKGYKGLGGSDALSFGWTVTMIQLKCCGVDGYEDFNGTEWDSTAGAKLSGSKLLKTPVACCKTLPSSAKDFACAQTTDPTVNNANTGCFDSLWDMSFGRTGLAVGILVACGIIQILFIVCAIIIIRSDKNKVDPI